MSGINLRTTLGAASLAFLVGASCYIAPPAAHAATFFTENFNDASVADTGMQVFGPGSGAFTGGQWQSTGGFYLRTADSDYNTVSFRAFVTIYGNSQNASQGKINFFNYLGFGAGIVDNFESNTEPFANPKIVYRPDDGFNYVVFDNNANSSVTTLHTAGQTAAQWQMPWRLRLTWDSTAKTVVYDVDENYNGTFSSDWTSPAFNGADNGFNGTNSRVFFGGFPSAMYFDDFSIQAISQEAAVPEPSTYALGLIALAGLGLFAWRRKRAA